MRAFTVSLFILKIVIGANTTLASTSTLPPKITVPTLTFDCDKHGGINNISGLPLDQLIWVDNAYCYMNHTLCKWQSLHKIRLMYVTEETNSYIAGGKNPLLYDLECKTGGFIGKAKAVLNEVKTGTSISHNYEVNTVPPPVNEISLTIEQYGSVALTAAVGDMLLLTFSGPGGYKIGPINCTAYSDALNSPTSHELWDDCKSIDKAILEDHWTKKNNKINEIEITMYAFRFFDSKKVVIECFANFCPESDAQCVNQCNPLKRKRRNVNKNYNTNDRYVESVSATFTVVENIIGANGSPGLSRNCILLATTLTFIIALSKKE